MNGAELLVAALENEGVQQIFGVPGEENLDFVDIATPPSTHAALATAALGRGLHVLCEKPLVTKPDDVAALSKLAKEKDRAVVTVHNWVHAAALAKITA